jgi:rRNA-processing protein FCF1
LRDRFGSTARIVVPQQVEQELQVLKNRSKKIAKQVAIALLAMTAFGVKIRKVKADNADDALVRLAKTGWTVVSNDRELVTRIKALKRPVWSFSEKKGNAGIND